MVAEVIIKFLLSIVLSIFYQSGFHHSILKIDCLDRMVKIITKMDFQKVPRNHQCSVTLKNWIAVAYYSEKEIALP
jgi:hypothetical protein